MELATAYRRPSGLRRVPGGLALTLSPNLRRDRVAFDAALADPLAFREAVSALHDVVISDLKFRPKDRSAYEAYRRSEADRERTLATAVSKAKRDELTEQQLPAMRPDLRTDFAAARKVYWRARQRYSNHLLRHDRELWRRLMPCDPVMTVADDVMMLECFSRDESSYGCLVVDRDRFTDVRDAAHGTTNVDYSWDLYEHFQGLRSYRETRFNLDPSGFDVSTSGGDAEQTHREEKIDLPDGWLRGFMQLQSAMALPGRRVRLHPSTVYNVLAFLKRHRAKKSPRAIRFELEPGRSTAVVLEPFDRRLEDPHVVPDDRPAEVVRVWGRDRLRVLRRVLPIAESFDVFLTGTGLPSFWVANLSGMRLVLGLSGWTDNDWTTASAMTSVMPPRELSESELVRIAATFKPRPAATLAQVAAAADLSPARTAAGLNRLALVGQVIHDLSSGVYRWRQVMPEPVTSDQIGGDDRQTQMATRIGDRGQVVVHQRRVTDDGSTFVRATVRPRDAADRDVEVLFASDGRITDGSCGCSHHREAGLRRGPCGHLQAARNKVFDAGGRGEGASIDAWYQQFWN